MFTAAENRLQRLLRRYDAQPVDGDYIDLYTEPTFDIPPGAAPEAIGCHDSMFSGGALLAP